MVDHLEAAVQSFVNLEAHELHFFEKHKSVESDEIEDNRVVDAVDDLSGVVLEFVLVGEGLVEVDVQGRVF